MFKSIVLYRCLTLKKTFATRHMTRIISRQFSSDNKSSDESINEEIVSEMSDQSKTSFAKAFEKFERMAKESKVDKTRDADDLRSEPFPTLLRYSPFIQMGDPVGKVVVGRVEDIVDDDLYIDFGCKFNAVCKRPKTNQSDYVRGAKVRLRINDLELSERFLGSPKDMTLLEADATLMGIVWSPTRSSDRKNETETQI